MMIALVLATGVALLALVTVNVMLGQTGIVRAQLQKTVQQKRTAVEQSSLEILELRSPARIAARAKKLGLVPATGSIVIASSTVRGPSPSRGRP